MYNPCALLNKKNDSSEFQHFASSIGIRCEFECFDDEFHLELFEQGLAIVADKEKIIKSIFMYNKGEVFKRFTGVLPFNIRFDYSKENVNSLLGCPSKSGGGETFLNELIDVWDLYIEGNVKINIRYMKNLGSIKLVSAYLEDIV